MSTGKIYAISDLHVDQAENMQWVEKLPNSTYLNDTIIIAGDVTHTPTKLIKTLKLLKAKFKDVYYCPGNHELWTKSQKEDEELGIYDSIAKYYYIMKICDEIGVRTKPGVTDDGVMIAPLHGWYDESLHIPIEGITSDLGLWGDSYRCTWTNEVPQTEAAKYFVKLNEPHISNLNKNSDNTKIVTFSHFLTSKKLMEAYRAEMSSRRERWRQSANGGPGKEESVMGITKANFTLVAGTELFNEQLQLIKPQIHIFGHSHRKMELNIGDGIRYINNPLGYVFERESGLIEPPHGLYELTLK